ncbi:TAXI family TRAP transporter solute-binding subunit [Arthrobacter sp. EH-1B-1]|uniref:TAXI family TRAP transporter solute-binding subunit n=1 Tax=Arthrobacter vasquezii TaxID=2977629 RepID=A0ABT6CS13_9MICC|nr:TAXI family TRAP transporter solute-binding subunit [Arthrobacter vasquezii]MDF9276848.1 TAXI family TRAP transporter solute-binding subunit [Arthrobacter vasquezii]
MTSTTNKVRGSRIAAAVLLAPALFLSACGSPAPSGGGDGGGADSGEGGTLSIATGGTGGVYYPLGGGFATVIRENVEGYDATVQETNASVDNILLLESGAADLALAVGDVVADAVEGVNDFEGKAQEICSLGNVYNNFLQPVTVEGTGIQSVEDMKGKVVSVGAPGSATEVAAIRTLEAAGLDPEADIDRRQLGVAETVAALRDGTIDAGFWSGGLPTGALIDLAADGDMVIVPIGEYAAPMAEEYGEYYVEQEIPAETYEGQTEPISVIASPNILVAPSSMDEQLQEDITTALFENKDQLIQVHPAAEEMDAATAGDVPFVETCPGAQAYYDQAG